ncbi:MAG: methyltransferase domain-containing protein [Erysipelotrichia bacterium]|nr:methyltransferase domain-containing protein [Erysipelotrichia bacterium]
MKSKFDWLPGIHMEIEQPEEMYHFNTDTSLLGQFLDLKHSDHVLDVGCNTGALLLYASCAKPEAMSGIDLFQNQIDQTKVNLKRHHLDAELQVCRFQDYQHKPFDALIINPPYFNTSCSHLISDSPYIAAARHERYLSMEDLFQHSERLLKDNGRLYLVHRVSRLSELIMMADRYHLHAQRLLIAYDSMDGEGKSAVVKFRKAPQGDLKIETPVFLNKKSSA